MILYLALPSSKQKITSIRKKVISIKSISSKVVRHKDKKTVKTQKTRGGGGGKIPQNIKAFTTFFFFFF